MNNSHRVSGMFVWMKLLGVEDSNQLITVSSNPHFYVINITLSEHPKQSKLPEQSTDQGSRGESFVCPWTGDFSFVLCKFNEVLNE
jgi:hypothetical protein